MQILLQVAERHLTDLGYKWHPDKCAIIEPQPSLSSLTNTNQSPPVQYKLYNKQIPKVQNFKYIGIPFNYKGINTNQLVNQCTSKATDNMAVLCQLGVHQYGAGLWPALRVYHTFI